MLTAIIFVAIALIIGVGVGMAIGANAASGKAALNSEATKIKADLNFMVSRAEAAAKQAETHAISAADSAVKAIEQKFEPAVTTTILSAAAQIPSETLAAIRQPPIQPPAPPAPRT